MPAVYFPQFLGLAHLISCTSWTRLWFLGQESKVSVCLCGGRRNITFRSRVLPHASHIRWPFDSPPFVLRVPFFRVAGAATPLEFVCSISSPCQLSAYYILASSQAFVFCCTCSLDSSNCFPWSALWFGLIPSSYFLFLVSVPHQDVYPCALVTRHVASFALQISWTSEKSLQRPSFPFAQCLPAVCVSNIYFA